MAIAPAAALLAAAAMSEAAAQNHRLEPTFGEQRLITGFLPDPVIVPLLAGGDLTASGVDPDTGETCVGYIADAPDYRLRYEAGPQYPLAFLIESDADTTLMVRAPNGRVRCNDDFDGLSPGLIFDEPLSGTYDIWVGTYDPIVGDKFPQASLSITEIAPPNLNFSDLERAFFGEDDRIRVDSSRAPWSMIGQVVIDGDPSCTGALVGSRLVLTAAHCLFDDAGARLTAETFRAGADGDEFVARSAVTSAYVPPEWSPVEEEGPDYALLSLAQPIGDRVGWMRVGPLSDALVRALVNGRGPTVMQSGYSVDAFDVQTANEDCPVLEIFDDGEVSHRCDTLPGDSGSPLFVRVDGVFQIIAVESHTDFFPGEEYDRNIAVSADVFADEVARRR